MKLYPFLLVFVLGLSACLPAWTQSMDEANAHYQRFNQMRVAGGDETALYDMLYLCYQDFISIVEMAPSDSPDYIQAKRVLREICPFLQSGATYYSGRNNQRKALLFAQAFMDIPLLPAFQGENFSRNSTFPTMAYFAASGTYNAGNYDKAIAYFKAYLNTGESKYRQTVYAYMAKACLNIGDYDLAMQTLEEASNAYPGNFNMLSMAINSCIEREDDANLQKFLSRALALRPSDETLLNIQGRLYENTRQFQLALDVYNRLKQSNPANLEIAQHIALNYYNLGVLNYNKESLSSSDADRARYAHLSDGYFSSAANVLEVIVANVPSSTKYLQALATVYSCLKDKDRLAVANGKLASIGGQTVDVNVAPSMIAYSDRASSRNVYASASVTPSSVAAGQTSSSAIPDDTPPLYSQYAKDYVERRIRWLLMSFPNG